MTANDLTPEETTALERIRLVLADVAPEIPAVEIQPDAKLLDDLRLDHLSVWALANGVENLAKVEIRDADVESAHTIGDLVPLAVSEAPLPAGNDDGGASDDDTDADESAGQETANASVSQDSEASTDATDSEFEGDLGDALADLADFFNG